jgi:cytochrome c-type biogenesis protein CcmH/NrfG
MAPTMLSAQRDELLRQAMSALQGQRPVEAERIAAAVLKDDPRHQRALHVLGCALLMQDRPQDALAPLEQAARGRHDAELDTQLAIALRSSAGPSRRCSSSSARPSANRRIRRRSTSSAICCIR